MYHNRSVIIKQFDNVNRAGPIENGREEQKSKWDSRNIDDNGSRVGDAGAIREKKRVTN